MITFPLHQSNLQMHWLADQEGVQTPVTRVSSEEEKELFKENQSRFFLAKGTLCILICSAHNCVLTLLPITQARAAQTHTKQLIMTRSQVGGMVWSPKTKLRATFRVGSFERQQHFSSSTALNGKRSSTFTTPSVG